MTSNLWDEFLDKNVRLLVKDNLKIRPRDGVFKGIDETHVFLLVNDRIIPFLRDEIKRVEVRDE